MTMINRLRYVSLLVLLPLVAFAASAPSEPVEPQVVAFLQAIAQPTAQAKLRSDTDVKFLSFGISASGAVTIRQIALGTGHDAALCDPEAVAIAHVHHKGMTQGPEAGDFEVAATNQCALFVIGADGSKIWQVAIRQGHRMHRLVPDAGWQRFDSDQ